MKKHASKKLFGFDPTVLKQLESMTIEGEPPRSTLDLELLHAGSLMARAERTPCSGDAGESVVEFRNISGTFEFAVVEGAPFANGHVPTTLRLTATGSAERACLIVALKRLAEFFAADSPYPSPSVDAVERSGCVGSFVVAEEELLERVERR